jgi:hypothetical protein
MNSGFTSFVAEMPVIQIGVVESLLGIGAVVLAVGIAWGKLNTSVSNIDSDVRELKTDVKDVRERFAALEGKTSGLYQAHSPISLTKSGDNTLTESGMKEYIDQNKQILIDACDAGADMRTPYDVQEYVFDFFDSHEFPQEVEDQLKTYAFNQGMNMDVLRRVGAIYLRDIALEQKGFDAKDIKG